MIETSLATELSQKLAQASKIVITTHHNPDGDAMGSILGLYNFLNEQGHTVTVISPNEFPEFLGWMPGSETIVDFSKDKTKASQVVEDADFVFFLDFNDSKRGADIKEALSKSNAKTIMIDHHPFPQVEVDYSISVTEASSTCELIYEFIEAIGGADKLSKESATCIYTGIMTDTGSFNYNSSRPRTFEIVARLLAVGIDKDGIARAVFDNYSESRMRLLGYCLNDKMQVFKPYNAAFMSINLEEQERFNFTTGDSEGFVNYPLSIKGIRFTAFFTERKDKVKISFRSKGDFAVNDFSAKYFGGGGHKNAAGGESNLSLNETIAKFIELLPIYEKELNS